MRQLEKVRELNWVRVYEMDERFLLDVGWEKE
jgi:hypothetical protein